MSCLLSDIGLFPAAPLRSLCPDRPGDPRICTGIAVDGEARSRLLCELSGQRDVPRPDGPGNVVFDALDEQAQFFIGLHGAFPTFLLWYSDKERVEWVVYRSTLHTAES